MCIRDRDMSFANQVLCAIYMREQHGQLSRSVHGVPPEIDQQVAKMKLAAMQITIDRLSDEQQRYLASWQEGT